jgi:hypothetical protein
MNTTEYIVIVYIGGSFEKKIAKNLKIQGIPPLPPKNPKAPDYHMGNRGLSCLDFRGCPDITSSAVRVPTP